MVRGWCISQTKLKPQLYSRVFNLDDSDGPECPAKMFSPTNPSKPSYQSQEPTFEHPLKETNQNPIVKNFGEFTPDSVTVKDLGDYNSLAIKLMKDAGWD